MRLLNPKEDYAQLSFVRPGERYRLPFFQIAPGENADESALSLMLPDLGKDTPARYAAALFVGDTIDARSSDAARAKTVEIKLQSVGGARKTVDVLLIEKDGMCVGMLGVRRPRVVDGARAGIEDMRIGAQHSTSWSPFPGLWNYWRDSAAGRGASGDRIHAENIERLQLTVFPNSGEHAGDDAKGAAVESIRLIFAEP